MSNDLTVSNFFKYYMFHPWADELKHEGGKVMSDSTAAKVGSIVLGICTLGISHAICLLFLYDKNVVNRTGNPSDRDRLVSQAANPQLRLNVAAKNVPEPTTGSIRPSGTIQPYFKNRVSIDRNIKVTHTDDPSRESPSLKIKCGEFEIRVAVVQNIALMNVDAVVNAANAKLRPGDGVCGDIEKAGGPSIFEECSQYLRDRRQAQLEDGEVIITKAGNLPANYVIHAVGPDLRGSGGVRAPTDIDRQLLYTAYYYSLLIAHRNKLKSIALPALSIGIFKFPIHEATAITAQAVKDFVMLYPETTVKNITVAVWQNPFGAYKPAFVEAFPQQNGE